MEQQLPPQPARADLPPLISGARASSPHVRANEPASASAKEGSFRSRVAPEPPPASAPGTAPATSTSEGTSSNPRGAGKQSSKKRGNRLSVNVCDMASSAASAANNAKTALAQVSDKMLGRSKSIVGEVVRGQFYELDIPWGGGPEEGAGEPGSQVLHIRVHHDPAGASGQHVLTFPESVVSAEGKALLTAGSCNLYTYPKYLPKGLDFDIDTTELVDEPLRLLDRIMVLLTTTHMAFTDTVDASGAYAYGPVATVGRARTRARHGHARAANASLFRSAPPPRGTPCLPLLPHDHMTT